MGTFTVSKHSVDPISKLSTYYPFHYAACIFSLFVLIKPSLLEQFSITNIIFKLLTALLFLVLFTYNIILSKRLTTVLATFIAFRMSFLIPTIVHQGDLLNWGYVTITQISLLMLFEVNIRYDINRSIRMIRCLTDLLLIYLAVNFYMFLAGKGITRLWDNGYIETWYLLGIRTRVTECFFTALMFQITYDRLLKKFFSIRSILIMLLGVIQVVLFNVVTAYVGIIVFVVVALIIIMWSSSRKIVTMGKITLIGITINILVVVFKIQKYFSFFITQILGRSNTLTGRTEIWDFALEIIKRSPFFGYGVNNSFGAFVPFMGQKWQAHNQYLQLMYDGGGFATILFVVFILMSSRGFDSKMGFIKEKTPVLAVYAAFSIMMVSEIFTFNMALFYLVPFFVSRFRFISETKEKNEQDFQVERVNNESY